jgi:hypothetical protein
MKEMIHNDLAVDGCGPLYAAVFSELCSAAIARLEGVTGSGWIDERKAYSRTCSHIPLSEIVRSIKMEAPPSVFHFMPDCLNRWVKRILQPASVTPLPMGNRRWRYVT